MKTVTIKTFQQNLYKAIRELPIQVTKYGKPIFYIVKTLPQEKVATIPTEIKKQKSNKPLKTHSPFSLCPQHKVYYSSCGCE